MSVYTPAKPQIFVPAWTSEAAKRGQSHDTFMRDLNWYLKNEVNLEKHTQCKREMVARAKSRALAGHTIDGMGKHIGEIPARDYFRALQVYGDECMDDKVFVREWLRDNPSHRAQS